MKYTNAYFIGIGGIGMSAEARYFAFKGCKVSGYDRTPSEITEALENEGIHVHYDDRPELLPLPVEETLVVYTPAVPDSLGELSEARRRGYRVIKRSRLLGEISEGQRCLAVAGTHGKTTTSTMVAHILQSGGGGCSAFLGGISKNYGTNLLVSKTPVIVAEADEFDRSFLQLHPEIAAITSIDADHLDIYGSYDKVHEAFEEFASQVTGTVIVKAGVPLRNGRRILRFTVEDGTAPALPADFTARNLSPDDAGRYSFDLESPYGTLNGVKVGVPGKVNVWNATAAAAICLVFGTAQEVIKAGLETFRGAKRRMDVHINTANCTYIDDYAHHPEELSSAISSMRGIFPGRKLTAVFQPHLYTRTRDFAEGFAEALSKVDKLILLDIYPAREEPIEGVTSEIIFNRVTAPEKVLIKRDELMRYLENEPVDVLATFGAGNIDRFVEPITEMLGKRIGR